MNREELKREYPQMPDSFMKAVNNSVAAEMDKDRKVIKMKKKIFLVLAATLAIAATAIGASKASYSIAHSNAFSDFTDESEIPEKAEDIGVGFKYVTEFENGYTFEKGHTVNCEDRDDNDTALRKYKSLDLVYTGDSGKLYFSAEKYNNTMDTEDGEKEAHIQPYKCFPADYELTEQDKEDMENGKYVFSYGSEEIEEYDVYHVSWHEDGVLYMLMQYSYSGSLTLDEMTEMAEEIQAAEICEIK